MDPCGSPCDQKRENDHPETGRDVRQDGNHCKQPARCHGDDHDACDKAVFSGCRDDNGQKHSVKRYGERIDRCMRQNIAHQDPEHSTAGPANGGNTGSRIGKYRSKPTLLGNTDPKKNTERTLVAYSKYLQQSDVKRKLLMADLDAEYLNGIIQRNHIENIKEHILMPGYIVNSDLPYIYNGAFAFLYTSLRESFGIPLLEAMACGTPVITSNTSSMPEIAGHEAILVNPGSSDEIAEMMLQLERDEDFYEKQKAIGLERAKLFSWRRTAEQLLRLYQEVDREK